MLYNYIPYKYKYYVGEIQGVDERFATKLKSISQTDSQTDQKLWPEMWIKSASSKDVFGIYNASFISHEKVEIDRHLWYILT